MVIKIEPASNNYYVNFWTQYNPTFSFFAFVQQILWKRSGATDHCWVNNQMRCILANTTQQLRYALSNIVLRMIQTWEQLWGDVWYGKIKTQLTLSFKRWNELYIDIPETLHSTESDCDANEIVSIHYWLIMMPRQVKTCAYLL